ncbi:MAG: guanylate kinase [Oligoflexales bacterium]
MKPAFEKPIIVVSAPSGTGKTTLNQRLSKAHPAIEMSVSYTTRKPRPDEIQGDHYFFVSETDFKERITRGDFLEWAKVHGQYYGTSKQQLKAIGDRNHTPILEIDTQGWLAAKDFLPKARSIFIFPPSFHTLWERLESRKSEELEARMVRLQNAFDELLAAPSYEFFIVNEDLEQAYKDLESIVLSKNKPKSPVDGLKICAKLKAEFESAPWIAEIRRQIAAKHR